MGVPAYFKMQQRLVDTTLCNPSPLYSVLSTLGKIHGLEAQAKVILELELL